MQAKNLKMMVEEFSIIPVQIILCYETYDIHVYRNHLYLQKFHIQTLSSKQLSNMFALFFVII